MNGSVLRVLHVKTDHRRTYHNLLNRFRSSFFISGLGVWDSSIRTDKYTKSDKKLPAKKL